MSENNEVTTEVRNDRKVREGLVVSDKMDKTIVVAVEDRKKHRRYSKVMRSTTKVKAHDDGLDDIALLDVAAGDRVLHRGDDDVADAGIATA